MGVPGYSENPINVLGCTHPSARNEACSKLSSGRGPEVQTRGSVLAALDRYWRSPSNAHMLRGMQDWVECKVIKDEGEATIHRFVAVPRIGETVILQDEADTIPYQVLTVTHLPGRSRSEPSVTIGLVRLNA